MDDIELVDAFFWQVVARKVSATRCTYVYSGKLDDRFVVIGGVGHVLCSSTTCRHKHFVCDEEMWDDDMWDPDSCSGTWWLNPIAIVDILSHDHFKLLVRRAGLATKIVANGSRFGVACQYELPSL